MDYRGQRQYQPFEKPQMLSIVYFSNCTKVRGESSFRGKRQVRQIQTGWTLNFLAQGEQYTP